MAMIGNIVRDWINFWLSLVGLIFTSQASDPLTGTGKPRLWVKTGDKKLHFTNTDGTDGSVLTTGVAQTVTAAMTFASAMLLLRNAADTFSATFTFAGTAARALIFPDKAGTLAVTGEATSATAPAFTGTAATTAVGTPLLSGTGLTAAGQVVTTTDNKTVTLDQYAGCWLLGATTPPCKIVSHPAATNAPVAFTVKGATGTDGGVYEVLAAPTPAGSVASHTHTNG